MASTTRKPRSRAPKHRASWRGSLTFGLVTFPVEAFNALDRVHGDIHFHQLHKDCHRRIQYKKVCPVHGEVTNDEIVSGYEYRKGKYSEIDPEELEALRTESDRALKIDAFVSPETVDPLYFDGRMYYLVPAGPASQEPYAVLVEALERENRCGVGQLVFSGRDQIALLRTVDGLLHMAMLNYAAEIRSPRKVAAALKKPKAISREVRLAQILIEEWSQDRFDFTRYRDTHRDKIERLIEAKVHGKDIVAPREEVHADVVNLMDALRKSIATMPKKQPGKSHGKRSA